MDIINAFPSKNSISDTVSPATIVEGKPKLDFSKPKISFGSYALVYTQTTNDMKTRADSPVLHLKIIKDDHDGTRKNHQQI